MLHKEVVYKLIDECKDKGSALLDCGDRNVAEQVLSEVKEIIKFYSNIDGCVIRDTEINLYTWHILDLTRQEHQETLAKDRSSNVRRNSRSNRRNNSGKQPNGKPWDKPRRSESFDF